MTRPVIPVHADWNTVLCTSRTTLTTHLWTAPPLRRGSPIHDRAFAALRELDTDHTRFLSFWTHPHLAVPALEPPSDHATSWDFTHLDPLLDDFMEATRGRPVVANLAAIPTWMFDTPEPVAVGTDPDAAQWDYEQGTQPRDATLNQIADYFERMARWYISGGFTDELGRRHTSPHRHRFAYWEVLCEPDVGHQWDPAAYTRLYDQVVQRLRPLDPDMRFVGLSLSPITDDPDYFWHFLDPANHAPGIPIDAVSYHFYAAPALTDAVDSRPNAPFSTWHTTFFAQADGFLRQVSLIESIKKRLSPHTRTHINEIGSFAPDVMAAEPDIPDQYWALAGALVAYLWSRLTALGIDLVGVAEFLGYPTVIPGTSLLDWETGEPNARYRVLALLLEHFGPGDLLVPTRAGSELSPEPPVHAQGFVTSDGRRRLLLVNTGPDPVQVTLTGEARLHETAHVDTATSRRPASRAPASGDLLELGPFSTTVTTLA